MISLQAATVVVFGLIAVVNVFTIRNCLRSIKASKAVIAILEDRRGEK